MLDSLERIIKRDDNFSTETISAEWRRQFLIYAIASEKIGFNLNASFARRPASRLIKPGDTTKES